jgi:hypothetical protein
MTTEPREASWSAPALWRFGRPMEFNTKAQRMVTVGNDLAKVRLLTGAKGKGRSMNEE